MTDETPSHAGRKPTHSVSTVREATNGKNFWTRIGAGWNTKSGGITIQLESVPLDGRLFVQLIAEADRD